MSSLENSGLLPFIRSYSITMCLLRAQYSSSSGGPISIYIMLYTGWGKDGLLDVSFVRSFRCKKFHSEPS